MRSLVFLFAFLSLFALPSARAQTAAAFNPPSCEVGDNVTYGVIFENISELPPNLRLPSVPGLTFGGNISTSSQMTIINGRMSQKIGANWTAQATREGTFTVPAWTVVDNSGAVLTIPAATLTVGPVSQERRDAIFWDIKLPEAKEGHIVGERIPITVSLFIRADHQVASRLQLKMTSDAVGFDPAQEVTQSISQKGGNSYRRYDWKGFLIPNKSGDQTLQFAAETVLIVPGRGISQQELNSPTFKLNVTPLPREGRPDHFDGAVGQYRLSQQQGSTTLAVGEALSVTLELAGTGDLQGSAGPGFPAADGLKIYPGRNPSPEPDDQGRIAATYTFTVIPTKAGSLSLPPARFAYYDSAAHQYVNVSTKAVPLTVNPSATAVVTPGTPSTSSQSAPPPNTPTVIAAYDLNLPLLGSFRSGPSLPLWQQPLFLVLQLLPAALLIGLIWMRQRAARAAADPLWLLQRVRRKALRHWAQQANRSAAHGDAAGFREAARRWLQYAAAAPSVREPAALSSLEAAAQLSQRRAPQELVSELTQRLAFLENPVTHITAPLPAELKETERLALRLVSFKV